MIVLTADETMMSKYRGGMFVGFASCMPQGILPDWFYFHVWAPPVQRAALRALYSDFGLRIVEASLAKEFGEDEVAIVHPHDLNRAVGDRTEIIAVGGHDYLGINPPTSEIVDLIDRGPPYNRLKFFELMKKPCMQEKIVVAGGKAAWQLADEATMDKLNIDYVLLGEAEITIPEMFKSILNGESLPRIVTGVSPRLEDIPNILGGTIHGLVEIGRGCGRGCSFCTPNMLNFMCKPIDHVERDVRTNAEAGQSSILLHSEDVLRYGATNMLPDKERVLKLFNRVIAIEGVDNIGTSHIALASAYHDPELISELAETCRAKLDQDWIGAQTGLETGSERLLGRYMRNKALPSSTEQWHEISTQAFGILDDNNWVCAATMINGLPGETADDVIKSVELVQELKSIAKKSLIIPMNYVAMRGPSLDCNETFTVRNMLPEHWQLLGECLDHDLNVFPQLLRRFDKQGSGPIKSSLLQISAKRITSQLRKRVETMRKGEPPFEREEPSAWLTPQIPDLNGK